MPINVLASPFVPNSPLTPKSQRRTWPERVRRMLEGLMSDENEHEHELGQEPSRSEMHTSVDNLSPM